MARFKPIEQPRNLKLKLAHFLTKRQYGKVMTPLKVIYARKPSLMDMVPKIFGKDKGLKLTADFINLIRYYVSVLNGCGFCQDIGKANMAEANRTDFQQRLGEVLTFRNSNSFTESEKAALAFVEELVQNKQVSDQTFEQASNYWQEEQLIDLAYLAASETYINLMNSAFEIEEDGLCNFKVGEE